MPDRGVLASMMRRGLLGGGVLAVVLALSLALVLVPGAPGVERAEAAAVASTQDGNWSLTATWGGNPVPGAADDVTITAGTTVTMNATATIASLTVEPGATFNIGGVSLTVTGTTTVNGSLSITSATGTKTLGELTIGGTGSFSSITESVAINGSFTNNGTFTSGSGTYTFGGTGVTLGGSATSGFAAITVSGSATHTGTMTASSTITISGSLVNNGTITGSGAMTVPGTATNNSAMTIGGTITVGGTLTNDGAFTGTGAGAVAGAGTFINAAGRTLTLAATSITATLDASAAGNTVEWNRAGTQTLKSTTYHHVIIGGASGAKTISSAVTINGNLEVQGGSLSVTTAALTVTGSTTLSGGGLTSSGAAGANTKTFAGPVTVQSGTTLTVSATTGTNAFTSGVTVEAGGTWTHSGTAPVEVTGNWVHRGAATLSSGPATITGNLAVEAGLFTVSTSALTVTGTTILSGGDLTSSGAAGAKTKTFTGDVTVQSGRTWTTSATTGTNQFDGTVSIEAGGTWTQTGAAPALFNGNVTIAASAAWTQTGAASVVFNGDIANSGTFTASAGTVTLGGTGKTASGPSSYALTSLSATGTVALTAPATVSTTLTVAGTLTNNSTLTLTGTGAVAGAGTFVNGAGATLTLASASFAPTMSAAASGSTVEWNRTNTQTVAGGAYFNLIVSGTGTKTTGAAATVAGAVTVEGTAVLSVTNNLAVTGNAIVNGGTLTITTPTVGVGGAVTIASGASWTHTGAGAVTITGGVTTAGTYSITAGTEAIGGDLVVNGGTTTFAVATVSIGGATSLSGGNLTSSGAAGVNTKTFTGNVTVGSGRTLLISATTGLNEFAGDVVVEGGGTWSQTGGAPVTFGGSVTNSGALTATTGTVTLSGASKVVSGNVVALAGLTVTGTLAVNGPLSSSGAVTVDGTLTNNAATTLTGTGALAGTGTIVNGATGTLTLASASMAATLDASAAGNTVDWNRGGTQTIRAATYHHLVLSGSSTKTSGGTIGVSGNLTVQGTAAFSVATDLSVTGNVSILGGSLTISTAALTVGGTTTLDGGSLTSSGAAAPSVKTFSGNVIVTSGTFTVSATTGTNALGAGLSVGAGGTWSHSGAAPVTIAQGVTTAGTFTASAGDEAITGNFEVTGGTATIGAAAVTIGGTTTLSGGNLVSSGTAGVKTKTFTGTFTVGAGRTFTLSATSGVNAFSDIVLGAGATWNQTSGATVIVLGDIQNGGALTAAAGSMMFTGTGKSITGNALSIDDLLVPGTLTLSAPLTSGGTVTVDGTLTNDSTLTITGTSGIAGSGTIVNNAARTFSLASSSMSPTLTATAAGNTVTWNRTSTQTVKPGSYHHLVLGGAGTKTPGGALDIAGDLTVGESAVLAWSTSPHTLHGNLVVTSDAAAPLTTTTNSSVTFAAPAAPGGTAISGTSTAALAFRIVNFENPSGVTVNLNIAHVSNPMTVASGVTLTLASGVTLSTTNTVAVSSGATIVFAATSTVSGTGTFALQSGATARITSPTGIAASGATGHVQTTTRTFDSGATYVYEGAAAQETGTGLPASTSTLTIDNAAGVTLSSDAAVTGTLTLTSGTFSLGSATLNIAGSVTTTGGAIAGGTSAGLAISGAGPNFTVPALTLGSFTVNRAAGVTLGGNLTVHGVMTLSNGLLTTGAHTLTVTATGSTTRTGGHVVGALTREVGAGAAVVPFEIGDATTYAPVTLDFADVTTPGSVTAVTSAGDHASIGTSLLIANHSVNRTWTLTPTGLVFTTAGATFTFAADDLDPTTDTSALVVSRFDGGTWTLPTTGTRTATSTQATGITGLGGFQVALRLQALSATTAAPGSATFGDTFPVAGVSTSGLVVAITTSGGCSGAGGGTATITMTSGTTACTVHYNQPGDSVYPAATELTSSTTAQKAAQTITATTAAPASASYAATFTVIASSTSALAVAVTTSGGCSGAGASSVLVTMTSSTVACGVQYAQSGDANYLAATPVNSSTTATPKALTVAGITVESRAVDGTTNARLNVTGATLVGVVPGDTVTLDASAAVGQFASANAGSGIPVTVTGLTIGGAQVALYSLTQPTLSASLFEEAAPPDDSTESLPPLGEPVNDGLDFPVPALPGTEGTVLAGVDTPTLVSAPAVVQTDGGSRIGQVTVTVPPAAIPGAASVSVRSIASIDALLAQAPAPSGGQIIAAISAIALDARGLPITAAFDAPVQVEVVLPALQATGALEAYVIVFWTGTGWTELETRVTRDADGNVRLTADVLHFTLFAVMRRDGIPAPGASTGAFAAPPVFGASGQAFAVYRGGSVAALESALAAAGGTGVWVQDASGTFRLLIAGGPAFLRDEFAAAFPAGFPSAIAITLVRPS